MANDVQTQQIEALVAPIVQGTGLYLEDVTLKRAGKYTTLVVTVDVTQGPGSVDSEQLERISREVSTALDESDPIAGAYTLEVTTPGAERALTEYRHYTRAEGRMIHAVLVDGTKLEARVTAVGDSGVTVTTYGEKNKQRVETGVRELAFDEISKAHIVVEL